MDNFLKDENMGKRSYKSYLLFSHIIIYDAQIWCGYGRDTPWIQEGQRFYTKMKYQT